MNLRKFEALVGTTESKYVGCFLAIVKNSEKKKIRFYMKYVFHRLSHVDVCQST